MIELLLDAERALTHGRIDHAEKLYRQVFAADPRSAIALVGLARVAIEREDDRTAYILGRQAMALDPENPAAERLVLRLAEVMTVRGDPVPTDLEVVIGAREGPPTAGPPPVASSPPPATQPSATPPSRSTGPPARPGLLRRLFGRRRGP